MNNIPRMVRPGRNLAPDILLILLSILASTRSSKSAHQVTRPVSNYVNQINQTYLWATESGTQKHRGLDFPNSLNTDVYAVADGVVVDLYEEFENGVNDPERPWGNYVLIRHSTALQHYDQTSSSVAKTYTIYAHLARNSVVPAVGDSVATGSRIAGIDDTGNSSSHHLHFQVVLNPSADLDNIKLEPINTLDSENRSRNPELWLAPYPGTGTAIRC